MGTTEHTEDMGPTMMLPAVVDLAAAKTLLGALRQRPPGQPCRLDASGVEKLMLPGVQVILAAVRSGAGVQVVDPSAVFRETFEGAALSWIPVDQAASALEPALDRLPDQVENDAASHQDQGPSLDPQPEPTVPPAAQAGPESPPAAEEPRTAKRILTIDDSKTMRDMLRMTLVDAGYDVLQAVDGQDGIDVLSKERVDVVITDINMPKLDGYGVIRHMRADAGYDETPILVLSTENDQKTKDIGRDAGATGWLVKPFDPDQLVEIVRQVSP
jgi:two-component system chemotaxis response regulator CheY